MGKYDFNFDLYEDSTLAWIAQTVKSNSTVLEFGAAHGRLTKFLTEEKKCCVHIVEIDQEAGTEASQFAEYAWIGAEAGDIESYHWTDSPIQYDYAIFADVLEHLRKPEEALKRCKAILKAEGQILVSVPNISHNSILIELLNDRFNYTPIGLLDNTHLKFFTRQSFIQMAERAGWAVIGEKAKYIRVGETEINNTYQDVPKEVFKYLANRDNGNVYQYLFTLAYSSEYLAGNCERKVLLDGSSHYFLQANYDFEGEYSYKRESTIHVNPYRGFIQVSLTIPAGTSTVLIRPLNCCCIVQGLSIQLMANGTSIRVENYRHNAMKILEDTYYFKGIPELEIEIPDGADTLRLEMKVAKYDFEDPFLTSLIEENYGNSQRVAEICNAYEAEIKKKDLEFQESSQIYEKEIQQKDIEFQQSVNIYENTIRQKDKEFKNSVDTYENMIREKDEEMRKSVESYVEVIRQKDLEFHQSAETYEKVITQKDMEFKESVETYEKVVKELNERLNGLDANSTSSRRI